MTFLQAGLIFHVVADSLHGREVAQVAIAGKSRCESTFTAIKEFWVRQLVLLL